MAEDLATPGFHLVWLLGLVWLFLTRVTVNAPHLVSSSVSGQRENICRPEGNRVEYSTWLIPGLVPGLPGCHLLLPRGNG